MLEVYVSTGVHASHIYMYLDICTCACTCGCTWINHLQSSGGSKVHISHYVFHLADPEKNS